MPVLFKDGQSTEATTEPFHSQRLVFKISVFSQSTPTSLGVRFFDAAFACRKLRPFPVTQSLSSTELLFIPSNDV